MPNHPSYDITIVGAGLVGATLALALRQGKLNIALLEAQASPALAQKCLALNYGSYQFLSNLGIWLPLQDAATPIHQVQVSQRGKFGNLTLAAAHSNLPALGYTIANNVLHTTLEQQLQDHPHCQLIRPAQITQIAIHDQIVSVIFTANGQDHVLKTKLLIAADGSNSSIRTLINAATQTIDYQQTALVSTIDTSEPHQHIAYERFSSNGAIAMLPLLSQQQSAMIWTAPNPLITQLLNLSPAALQAKIQTEFGYRLGKITAISQPTSYPLHFISTKQAIHGPVILLGNAAHTIHPLAAQGLNIGLHLTQALQQQILNNHALGQALTHNLVLSPQKMNLQASHALLQIFATTQPLGVLARQLGVICVDHNPLLKRYLIKQLAMVD